MAVLRHREGLRELKLFGVKKRRLRDVTAVANCLREVIEKMEPDSWWRCIAKGQEAADTTKRSLTKCKGKQKFQNEGHPALEQGHREKCYLHPWILEA